MIGVAGRTDLQAGVAKGDFDHPYELIDAHLAVAAAVAGADDIRWGSAWRRC
ncbi:MAG: hypothetical protein HY270_07125 [Deltaproteobacteria bacterium]|nr:hypothetical protein [Deltaproteobacteria bacterium]